MAKKGTYFLKPFEFGAVRKYIADVEHKIITFCVVLKGRIQDYANTNALLVKNQLYTKMKSLQHKYTTNTIRMQ